MNGRRSQGTRTKHRWNPTLAAVAVAGLLIAGCGADNGQPASPAAPSPISSNDGAGGGAHTPGTESTGTLTADGNAGAGNGSEPSNRTSDGPGDGAGLGPVVFTKLPAGYNAAQLEAMVDERNAQFEGDLTRTCGDPGPEESGTSGPYGTPTSSEARSASNSRDRRTVATTTGSNGNA